MAARKRRKRPAVTLTKEEVNFYGGVLSALAVVESADSQSVYDEIVDTMDEDKLIAAALDNPGTAEWAGLVRYGYVSRRLADEYK